MPPRRIAVALGSNGPDRPDRLQYAPTDAARVADALRRYCGFSVRRPRAQDPYSVLRALDAAAKTCTADDDFAVYFSGHGEIDRGELYLLLDRSEERLFGSAIPASAVMAALKNSEARNKLLILDCCHAGAAAGLKGTDVRAYVYNPTTLVLCASGRLEKAREIKSLKGSFLAYALTEVIAGSETLTVGALLKELQRRAEVFNASEKTQQVPIPYFVGEMKRDFLLRGSAAAAATPPATSPAELYEKLSAAAAPLTSLTARLTIPATAATAKRVGQRKAEAEAQANNEGLIDLVEHGNAGPDDVAGFVESAMRRHVVQPLIRLLATDRLEEGYGLVAIALGRRCAALLCTGWLHRPDLFEMKGNVSVMPSGIAIGDDIDWDFGVATPRNYRRKKTISPKIEVDVAANAITLTLDADPRSLRDALLHYTKARMTATMPEEIMVVTWLPSRDGEDDAFASPFDSPELSERLRTVPPAGASDRAVRTLRLELIPNDASSIARAYELSLTNEGEPRQGPRGDDEAGYVRVWQGRAVTAG